MGWVSCFSYIGLKVTRLSGYTVRGLCRIKKKQQAGGRLLLHKNHLNVMKKISVWSGKRDSNPPPTAWKAVALPDELLPHKKKQVGEEGFEPPKA